jgi:hypothetical protein
VRDIFRPYHDRIEAELDRWNAERWPTGFALQQRDEDPCEVFLLKSQNSSG